MAGTVRAMIVGSSTLPGPECDRLVGRAKTLSWLSLAYITAEGAIAIAAAILSSSVALLGFGLDSAIEGRLMTECLNERDHVGGHPAT